MWKAVALLLFGIGLMASPARAQRLKVSVPLDKLEAAARADSNDAAAHYNVALGYWSKERWDQAEASLQECLELEPRFALAHLALAYLPFARRPKLWKEWQEDKVPTAELPTLQQVERDYRRAFMFNPMVDLRIVGAVMPPKSWVWGSDPYLSRIYDNWVQAFEDFRNADYSNAYRRFDRMVEAVTSTGTRDIARVPVDILWYQGLSAAQLGMYDAAVTNVTEVLRRVQLEEDEKDEDRAELAYNALRANEYRFVLGVLHLRAGNHVQGRELLEEAAAVDLGLYMAHVNLALSYEEQNRWQEAVAARRAALAANPEDPSSMIELAISLSRAGGTTEVAELLAEVARTNPRNARAYYLLGLTQQQLGRTEEARAAFEHFLSIAPSRGTREIADVQRRLGTL